MDNDDNSQLCRICIAPNSQMISIFGEDSLWQKITTLADVKIEKGDTLPQQVCVHCAKNAISACLFKKKCEDADNFFRQQLLIQKIEGKANSPKDTKLGILEREEANYSSGGYLREREQHSEEDDHLENGKESCEEDAAAHQRIMGNGGLEDHHHSHHYHHQQQQQHVATHNRLLQQQQQNQIVEDDGEIKCANGVDKPPFDFQSIRLMHEYMQQQLSKFNGTHSHMDGGSHSAGSGSDGNADGDDDDEPLPLIPEIELITPSEDMAAAATAAPGNGSMVGNVAPLRGYQCPNCFQIFEMKQILKAHMQSVHGTAGPVYECSNCKKTYFYKRFLEKHVRRGRCVKKRRNQTRPMQCSDCHVLFPTGHHLGWHKRTGCPSRAAKMPLQQLFKQNIVQYNNFPKRIGIRKPENAIYLHNRKLLMSNKRKGRTRIKLDAKKIALAKQLILREATTTVIANELNISRTFAWRLRKSLVNGVSLHERVIDPNAEEMPETTSMAQQNAINEQGEQQAEIQAQQEKQQIKYEHRDEEDEDDGDDDEDDEDEEDEPERPSHDDDGEADGEDEMEDHHPAAKLLMNQTDDHLALAEQYAQLHQTAAEVEVGGENDETETEGDADADNTLEAMQNPTKKQRRESELQQQHHREQQHIFLQNMALHGVAEDKVAEAAAALKDLKYQKNFINGGNGLPLVLPPLHPFPAGISMASLPVNLSIRPLASLQQKKETPPPPPPPAPMSATNSHQTTKKPRKPNVFIDDEKYAMAQTLVSQNASTMEIARALNVSQMTAWKVRDAIIKGVPLSYRNKRGEVGVPRPLIMNKSDDGSTNDSHADTPASQPSTMVDAEIMKAQLRLQQQEQLQQQLQQQLRQEEQQKKLLEQQLREQQQQQQLKQLEQLQQQQLQLQQEKLILQQEQQRRRQQQEEEQKLQKQLLQQQQQQQQQHLQPTTSSQHANSNNAANGNNVNNTKLIHPRRRLKAAEREQRDKEITREILELIKEDSNIQYWKVSARLAEKGYPISPSSVCQKLKSMGIHRRWKPGDKPPLMLATPTNDQLKSNFSVNAANSSSADESYDQQFELGGAHFLSAFTR